MRSIWKGNLNFSLVNIPVKIYAALEAGNDIKFNQINSLTGNGISYKKVDKVTGEDVRNEDIVKGFQYEPGQYVTLTTDEINAVKPESSKSIIVDSFVDLKEVDQSLFDTPYFLGPDNSNDGYSLLVAALKKSKKAAIAKLALRDKENQVLLSVKDNIIMVYKLRYSDEIRDSKNVPGIEKTRVNRDQLALTLDLINTLSKPLDKIKLVDSYKDNLNSLIAAKLKGKDVRIMREDKPVIDIMTALKKSIKKAS